MLVLFHFSCEGCWLAFYDRIEINRIRFTTVICTIINSTRMDCSRCRKLWALSLQTDYVLHRDAEELTSGVQSGCWVCRRIESTLQQVWQAAGFHKPSSRKFLSSRTQYKDSGIIPIDVIWINKGPFPSEKVVNLFFKPNYTDRPVPALSGHTGSVESWRYVLERLRNCQAHHDLCAEEKTWLPTRLVEICSDVDTPRPVSYSNSFRVVESANIATRRSYATVSHMWGAHQTIALTTETQDAYTAGISNHMMPKKYLEAAIVARRLGIKYLWIDSLVSIPLLTTVEALHTAED